MIDPANLPNGSAITFAIEDPFSPGSFIELGCQKDGGWDETRGELDVSCKDSRAMIVRPGQLGGSWELELIYQPTDPGFLICRDFVRTFDTLARLLRTENAIAVEEVDILITSLSHAAPYEDTSTVSISATQSGEYAAA